MMWSKIRKKVQFEEHLPQFFLHSSDSFEGTALEKKSDSFFLAFGGFRFWGGGSFRVLFGVWPLFGFCVWGVGWLGYGSVGGWCVGCWACLSVGVRWLGSGTWVCWEFA